MPKAANQFDYDTSADVLFTVEYTALDSYEYRQEVLQRLDPELSTDRVFSFREELADQWYDLNNPERTSTPMTVSFETERADFLPNISDLTVENPLLYLVGEDETELDKIPVTLTFTDHTGTVGGESVPIDGVISTRRGTGAAGCRPSVGCPSVREVFLFRIRSRSDGCSRRIG